LQWFTIALDPTNLPPLGSASIINDLPDHFGDRGRPSSNFLQHKVRADIRVGCESEMCGEQRVRADFTELARECDLLRLILHATDGVLTYQVNNGCGGCCKSPL
jgi:hypothetical protein